jgi:triosephosphate isomerase
MRRPVIAGNWKMYKTPIEGPAFLREFAPLVAASGRADIVICPSFLGVPAAVDAARGTNVAI